ncbi:hypothetical protein HDU92_006885 [Lobulomyces angularis]|nr:hypothetical protein HDU92_006885 [Lobulomyces angularis]
MSVIIKVFTNPTTEKSKITDVHSFTENFLKLLVRKKYDFQKKNEKNLPTNNSTFEQKKNTNLNGVLFFKNKWVNYYYTYLHDQSSIKRREEVVPSRRVVNLVTDADEFNVSSMSSSEYSIGCCSTLVNSNFMEITHEIDAIDESDWVIIESLVEREILYDQR